MYCNLILNQDATERANTAENDAQSLRNKVKLLELDVKKAEERADLLEVRNYLHHWIGSVLRSCVKPRRRSFMNLYFFCGPDKSL
jgi:hypothetical protein